MNSTYTNETREYILTETSPEGCTFTNAVTVTVEKSPIVDAGSDALICEGEVYAFTNNASELHTSSYSWTHSGNGTLEFPNTISPNYTPGVGETGTVVFTLIGLPNNPCSDEVSDTFALTITPKPTADAGTGGTFCGDDTFQLSGTASGSHILAKDGAASGTLSGPRNSQSNIYPQRQT